MIHGPPDNIAAPIRSRPRPLSPSGQSHDLAVTPVQHQRALHRSLHARLSIESGSLPQIRRSTQTRNPRVCGSIGFTRMFPAAIFVAPHLKMARARDAKRQRLKTQALRCFRGQFCCHKWKFGHHGETTTPPGDNRTDPYFPKQRCSKKRPAATGHALHLRIRLPGFV